MGISPSCRLGIFLTPVLFLLAGGSSRDSFDGSCHLHLAVMGTSVVGLACDAHVSLASVFCDLRASSPLHRPSLGCWMGSPTCPQPPSRTLGASFPSQLLCLTSFEPKLSGQGAFDGGGSLWLCLCLGVLLFQTARAEFLLQLSSLCPSRYLFVWEPAGEFHLLPYQPYLLLP